MADQAINALSTKTAPETSDQLLLVGTGEPQLIDYDKLADAILNKITSKNYALDAGQMTLLAALNKLNSNNGKLLCVKKSTNESKGTLKFTYNGRLAAIALVTRNGASSLAYYIGINSGNTFSINKLGGGDIDITVDLSEKTISFPVPDWSTVLMISIGGADLK